MYPNTRCTTPTLKSDNHSFQFRTTGDWRESHGEAEKLQELSLVSKVCQALENHLGMSDKTLAEFVIDLVRSSSSCASFLASIKQDELPLPPALAENLYRIVQTMAPRKMAQAKAEGDKKSKKHEIRDDEMLTAEDIAGVDTKDDEEDKTSRQEEAKSSSRPQDRESDDHSRTRERRSDEDRYGRDRSDDRGRRGRRSRSRSRSEGRRSDVHGIAPSFGSCFSFSKSAILQNDTKPTRGREFFSCRALLEFQTDEPHSK